MPKYPERVFIARGPNCWGRDFFSARSAIRACVQSCPSFVVMPGDFVEFVVHEVTDPKATISDLDGSINYSALCTCTKVGQGRAKVEAREVEVDGKYQDVEIFTLELEDCDEDQTPGPTKRLGRLTYGVLDAMDAIDHGIASVKEKKESGAPDIPPAIRGFLTKAKNNLRQANSALANHIRLATKDKPDGDWRPDKRGPLCGTRYDDTCGCKACEAYCDSIDGVQNQP